MFAQPHRKPSTTRHTCRLAVEWLEDRTALSPLTVPILPDFNQTGSPSHVVHLGDNNNDTRFIPPSASGTTLTLTFDLPPDTPPLVPGSAFIRIDQYQADNSVPEQRSFVTLNGNFLGRFTRNSFITNLSGSSTIPVLTDAFAVDSSLLASTNTLVVHAGDVGIGPPDTFDDFCVTNIRLDAETEARPDIAMLSAQLQAGNTVQFAYQTTGNPGPFLAGLYASTDATHDPSDVLITTRTVTPSPTNPQAPGVFTLPINFSAQGRPYLVVFADPPIPGSPNGMITETAEDNNAAAIALPDLLATSFDFSVTHNSRTFTNNFIPVDSSVQVTTTIWNRGVGAAGAFKVTLYLSTDAVIDPAADYRVTDFSVVPNLLLGATAQLAVTAVLPSSLPQAYAGLLWLGVVVDSDRSQVESDEQNNSNQATGDKRLFRMWDALTTPSVLPTTFATPGEALNYLRDNGYRYLPFDGWSSEVGPTYSRFNGKMMPAGAFRLQAGNPYRNTATGRWEIRFEGPEPNPRTAPLLALQPQYGVEWLIYVYRYHLVVD